MGKLLHVSGIFITLASIVMGVYLQASLHEPRYGGPPAAADRALLGIVTIVAIGIGMLVIAAGQMVTARERRSQ